MTKLYRSNCMVQYHYLQLNTLVRVSRNWLACDSDSARENAQSVSREVPHALVNTREWATSHVTRTSLARDSHIRVKMQVIGTVCLAMSYLSLFHLWGKKGI